MCLSLIAPFGFQQVDVYGFLSHDETYYYPKVTYHCHNFIYSYFLFNAPQRYECSNKVFYLELPQYFHLRSISCFANNNKTPCAGKTARQGLEQPSLLAARECVSQRLQ